jgi:hypothetical protein
LLVALKPARDEFKERRTALVNRTYEMMRSLDKQHDEFIFLDLLTHFNRLDKPLTSYYGKQSSHFNPEGYRKTAQFIHERMLQKRNRRWITISPRCKRTRIHPVRCWSSWVMVSTALSVDDPERNIFDPLTEKYRINYR